MRMPADSVILASANLAVLALFYLIGLIGSTVTGCCLLGVLDIVLGFLVCPFLLALTIAYAIRDLVRKGTRWQAVIALVVSIPIAIWFLSFRLDV